MWLNSIDNMNNADQDNAADEHGNNKSGQKIVTVVHSNGIEETA